MVFGRVGGIFFVCLGSRTVNLNGSYVLKMKAAVLYRALLTIYQTARRHILEDNNLHSHRHENIKPQNAQNAFVCLCIFTLGLFYNGHQCKSQ
jgi:hypothetical protein